MQLTPPTEIGSAVECAAAATAMYGGRYASMDGGGRATQEQLPRAMQDDSMDGIGSVVSGTKTEQLPATAINGGRFTSRDGGGMVAPGTKTEQLLGSES